MTTKGFADTNTNIETPNDVSVTEKPLKSEKITSNRVDINVLKSKLQENESREFKKKFIYSFDPNYRIGYFRNLLVTMSKFAINKISCLN